jgi:transcriptional regulator with XRE-family HTH domain
MALGYLSEIERGQKEVSSEILDDLATALRVPTYQLIIEAGYLMGGTPNFVPVELELERV